MIETSLPLTIPPGMLRNGTPTQAMGRWTDGNLVRFFEGTIRPLLGFTALTIYDGSAYVTYAPGYYTSNVYAWADATGYNQRVAFGSTSGLTILLGNGTWPVTPTGFTANPVVTTVNNDQGVAITSGDVSQATEPVLGPLAAHTWEFDNFGDYLVAVNNADEKMYVCPDSGGNPGQAVVMPNSPLARSVVVTPERFVVALGTTFDGALVQWASQETYDTWTPAETNSAGSLRVATKGALVCGRRGKNETLLWTTADLHRMTYIGQPFVYGIEPVGDACGIISSRAVAMIDGVAFWMGQSGFFQYDGGVRAIECEVLDAVFGNINRIQATKIWALSRPEFGEVTWYYPDATAMDCTQYVTYNYRENHWTTGQLTLTAGTQSFVAPFPIVVDSLGNGWEMERGMTRPASVSVTRTTPVPFLTSGPVRVGAGDEVLRVQKLIPDDKTLGDVTVSFDAKMQPDASSTHYGPFTLSQLTDVRFTARYVNVTLTEAAAHDWRVGAPILGILPGGRR